MSHHATIQHSFVDQVISSTLNSIRQPLSLLTSSHSSPTQLALLLPLLASTANLTFSASQFLSLRPLLVDNSISSKGSGSPSSGGEKELPARSIQRWWEGYWIPGLGVVVGLGTLSAGGGIRAAMMRNKGIGGGRARMWYTAGTIFSLAHFAFAPQVAQILKAILQGPPKAVATNSRRWLELHASRTVLCDIPGFICFLLAVMS